MSTLNRADRVMLLQIAFAAANHRLDGQIEPMANVLPYLVKDPHDRTLCHALLLYGAGNNGAALNCLQAYTDDEADNLRQLILTAPSEPLPASASFQPSCR
jgi:type III secretion system SsaH family protein